MKFRIRHSIRGRIRVTLLQKNMTDRQADQLAYYFQKKPGITCVKVYERTCGVAIRYEGKESEIIDMLSNFSYENAVIPKEVEESSTREMNRTFKEKLVSHVLFYYGMKAFVPAPIRNIHTLYRSTKYIWEGLKCLRRGRLDVPVLDGTAIGVSVLRGDFATAGSVMFMLGIGELLEEWTHKKSVGDLAKSMSLNIKKVWFKEPDGDREILVPSDRIKPGDTVVVRMGNIIPFDGTVCAGEGMVNQASLTGEPAAVRKKESSVVYAGTVLEEGELYVTVSAAGGSTRYEKIMAMIEESEKLKSAVESKAQHLADSLVPYTLAGTGLVYLLTRNVTKALAVLMVDFSCALKLATPIAVLSAIKEAGQHSITVKGGKFLEAVAAADTIVFDKTGTITKATPAVKEVVAFRDDFVGFWDKSSGSVCDELLRIAACLEEHFPHSMAKAVVRAAKEKGLDHEELHSKVEYIVAHGISSTVGEHTIIIGSSHFVFEDEGAVIPEAKKELFESLDRQYSHLYMAVDKVLAAVICIEDPVREEAAQMIAQLKEMGVRHLVMMTGDSEHTAKAIAAQIGIDEVYAEVLPSDKADFVEKEKKKGRTVMMIGDGVNDSPALSAADVGVAVSDGSELAREIADITIAAEDLRELVKLRALSHHLMRRIRRNYRQIVGINSALIGLGVAGVIMPTASAFIHNASTLWISTRSMRPLLTSADYGEDRGALSVREGKNRTDTL